MIIKKFQGKTEDEAVSFAKKELGNGVVIMNVRNARKKGFFSIFRKSMVEVTVALEEEQEKPVFKPRPIQKPAPVKKPEPVDNHDIIKEPEPERQPVPGKDRLLEEKLDSLQSFIEKQLAKEEKPEEENTGNESTPVMKLVYNTLIENEVTEKYAGEIISEVGKVTDDNSSIDFVLANVYQKMILQFGQPQTIYPATDGVKVVIFIGPTGVGKTTTIAKIASILAVNDKKKIALLTTDTYRVGAAEQLRTYAGILEVPFRVIYTSDEMETAIKDFSKCDYILVDTAGHSHHNEELKRNVSQFIACIDENIEKDIFLVLSATTKYRDLVNITDAYEEFTGYKLIFTKLDETMSYGNLFNLRMHTGADMSYITCGQSVPDDIEPFSPQTTVKQLLGGR
ncbi:MAG: flagellar biosynthesis protein FlhF [Lachnospiraceae bacterium]|nr:flagellar biosynthesis protein FlhF [Lachnospiraceae bacterium]